MKKKARYAEIRLVLGSLSLVVGFLAANLALFQWVESTGVYYLFGAYARYVCAYGGFAAMIFGAMLVDDFLVMRKIAKKRLIAKDGLTMYCNVGREKEEKAVTRDRHKKERRKIAAASFAIFLTMYPIAYSLVSYTATVVIMPLSFTRSFISYRSNTEVYLLNSPKERTWNGSAWSISETEMATAGSAVLWIRAAYCPNSSRRNEKIVVTLSSDDYLDAYVWNGSAWKVTNNIGQVNTAAGTYQSFDIAYEHTSGKVMLVYSVLSTDATRDLGYRIWNGTNWSNEAYIDDTGHSSHVNYRWVELESKPKNGFNEIALIAIDIPNSDCNGWIWNGNTWGNYKELENALAAVKDNKLMAVAYEQNSGKAMFAWGYNNYMESRRWNGTGWENELSAISLGTLNVRWISMKADPASNRLMAIVIDGSSNLYSVYWDGNAWGSPVLHDDGVTHSDKRCADFDWEPIGSKGLLVWSTAQNSVSYKTFTAPSTWSDPSTASNPGGHPWIQLRRNPKNGDVKILGATLNSNQYIFGFKWNGSALTFEATAFTTDTTMIAYECFDIAFQQS